MRSKEKLNFELNYEKHSVKFVLQFKDELRLLHFNVLNFHSNKKRLNATGSRNVREDLETTLL